MAYLLPEPTVERLNPQFASTDHVLTVDHVLIIDLFSILGSDYPILVLRKAFLFPTFISPGRPPRINSKQHHTQSSPNIYIHFL